MPTEFAHSPQVNPTQFFKIILAQSLREGKLMIPRKFVKKYGEVLEKTVVLKTPNGAEWKLDLLKRDGKIWFQKGWKEFAESHSLAHGHLLVFRYEGTSHFQVHIFDRSALEINYPFKRVEANRASNGEGNKHPNDESLEDHRAGQKRKVDSPLQFLQPCEMGSSSRVKAGNTLKLQKVALHHTDRKGKGKQIITAKKVTALDKASSFKTYNPSFHIVMRPSYVKAHGMNLPYEFVRRHFGLGENQGDIHLRGFNGRVWPARYRLWEANTYTSKKCVLSKGWKAFVKDNNLKVGDVCTFELIIGTKHTVQVHIFRETDNSTCSTSHESAQTRTANSW